MPDTPHDPVSAAPAGMVPPGDPRAVIWNLIRGPWRYAAVHALAELGCPAHLAAGPLPVTELAARCDADPAALERLLRCAAGIGLLAKPSPGRYGLTPAGRVLVPAVPGSMHAAILATGDPAAWQAMTGLAGPPGPASLPSPPSRDKGFMTT